MNAGEHEQESRSKQRGGGGRAQVPASVARSGSGNNSMTMTAKWAPDSDDLVFTKVSPAAIPTPISEPSLPELTQSGVSHYLKIATEAHQRGFSVTPIREDAKIPILRGWNKYPATKMSQIHLEAKDFPDFNVAVVSRRGVGNLMFLDIDADGWLQKIEQEIGPIPPTYTVQSRPESAPWKRHFYFQQTAYSVPKWTKQVNRKDLTKLNEKGLHPTAYDLKAVGGAGYVLGAGSIRDNDEVYSVENDVPVIPIPDNLVDWLAKDIHEFRSAKAKMRQEREETVAAIAPDELPKLKDQDVPSAYEISEDDRYIFLVGKARLFANQGVRRNTIEILLQEQCRDFCAGGKAWAESEGRDAIHRLAFDGGMRIGHAGFFPKSFERRTTCPRYRLTAITT